MDAYQFLQHVVGVQNVVVRQKLVDAGFGNLDEVYKKPLEWSGGVVKNIMSSRYGPPEHRHLDPHSIELLKKFVLYQKLRYLCGRTRTYANSTLARMNQVYEWFEQQEADPEDTVANFTDGCNKRLWIESIEQYLSIKKGQALVPLAYVIRRDPNRPEPAPEFGFPTMDHEIATRGRLSGHFWAADNRSVWLFLRKKCHGTTAWTVIVEFERRADGRSAFLALIGQYLGRDYQRNLLKAAVTTLENLRFDGRSKNWTFDRFIGKMRQCFVDMGPNNQLTEERKVMALQAAWQVPGLQHLDAMMQRDYSNDFNGAVTFLAEQLHGLKLKNGPIAQAAVGTVRTDDKDTQAENSKAGKTSVIASLKKEIKALKKEFHKGNKKSKDKPAKGKKPKTKYDPKDPGGYYTRKAWAEMSDAQKEEARKSRTAAGVPPGKRRGLGSLSTAHPVARAQVEPMAVDQDDDASTDSVKPLVQRLKTLRFSSDTKGGEVEDDRKKPAAPPQVLVSPKIKQIAITQRAATYAMKPRQRQQDKSNQDDPDDE